MSTSLSPVEFWNAIFENKQMLMVLMLCFFLFCPTIIKIYREVATVLPKVMPYLDDLKRAYLELPHANQEGGIEGTEYYKALEQFITTKYAPYKRFSPDKLHKLILSIHQMVIRYK